MYNNLSFSRYYHHFEKNGIYAIFHSLKMKPVFITSDLFNQIHDILESSKDYMTSEIKKMNNGETILSLFSALQDNRVLNEKRDRDDEVINYFRNSIIGSQIKIAYFILAESCNLSCAYCFEKAPAIAKDKSKIMSRDVALKSLNFYERMLKLYPSENEEKDIIFYGGEPLLNIDTLRYVLDNIKQKQASNEKLWANVKTSIVTNGTLLTEEIVNYLADAGVSISISIDGPNDVTNSNRFYPDKRPAFHDIMKGINLCKNNGVNFSLSLTLSEETVKNYKEVIEFINKVKPSSIGFNVLMTDKNSSLYEGYNDEAADFMIEAFQEFRKIGLYEDRMMRKAKAFVESRVYPFDCGATGANQLVFSPSGLIGICHGYLQDKKYFSTNIDDNDFKPIENDVFIEWAKRSPLNMDECQDCEALGICGGGCPMNAEANNNSIWDMDERFCVHSKKTLKWLVWDLYDKTF